MSENNKELNQLHSAERDIDVTNKKPTLPLGFSVDSKDATGRAPLMSAALKGNVEAVKSLIKRSRPVPDGQRRMEFVTLCRTRRRHRCYISNPYSPAQH